MFVFVMLVGMGITRKGHKPQNEKMKRRAFERRERKIENKKYGCYLPKFILHCLVMQKILDYRFNGPPLHDNLYYIIFSKMW